MNDAYCNANGICQWGYVSNTVSPGLIALATIASAIIIYILYWIGNWWLNERIYQGKLKLWKAKQIRLR